MRIVCGRCHSKDQLDQIDITSMEDELSAQRAQQRKLILRVVGITIGVLVALLAILGRLDAGPRFDSVTCPRRQGPEVGDLGLVPCRRASKPARRRQLTRTLIASDQAETTFLTVVREENWTSGAGVSPWTRVSETLVPGSETQVFPPSVLILHS